MLVMYACSGWVVYRNTGGRDFGWESFYSRDGWTVGRIYPGGPADGKLQSGDRILAFNGDPRAERVGPRTPFANFFGPARNIRCASPRHGEPYEYKLRVEPWVDWNSLPWATSYIFLSVVNFVTGMAMGLLKPRDRLAQLGFLTQMLNVLRNLASPLHIHPGTAPDLEFMLNQVVSYSFPCVLAVGYDFFLRMSAQSATELVWRVIQKILYGVSAVLGVSQLAYLAATLRGEHALIDLAWRGFWLVELNVVFLKTSWEVFLAGAFSAICALIVWGYRHSRDIHHRRQIRWFAAGCTVGLAPELLLNLTGSLIASSGHTGMAHERNMESPEMGGRWMYDRSSGWR